MIRQIYVHTNAALKESVSTDYKNTFWNVFRVHPFTQQMVRYTVDAIANVREKNEAQLALYRQSADKSPSSNPEHTCIFIPLMKNRCSEKMTPH